MKKAEIKIDSAQKNHLTDQKNVVIPLDNNGHDWV